MTDASDHSNNYHQSRLLLAPQSPLGKALAHAPRAFMLSDLSVVEIEQAEAGTRPRPRPPPRRSSRRTGKGGGCRADRELGGLVCREGKGGAIGEGRGDNRELIKKQQHASIQTMAARVCVLVGEAHAFFFCFFLPWPQLLCFSLNIIGLAVLGLLSLQVHRPFWGVSNLFFSV